MQNASKQLKITLSEVTHGCSSFEHGSKHQSNALYTHYGIHHGQVTKEWCSNPENVRQ